MTGKPYGFPVLRGSNMNRELLTKAEELNDKYVQMWADICSIESPTDFKQGVDEVGRYFTERAAEQGWDIEIHEEKISGNCISITMNCDSDEAPVVFSGHMDTVHAVGSFGSPAVRCEGDTIYGPGVKDCKGGITAAFMAMEILAACGFKKRPVRLILQSDEEVGSAFSEGKTIEFMREKAQNAVGFFNCEAHRNGGVTLMRKGSIKHEFEIRGKAVHSSNCYLGASAITEAAYKIIELEKMKDKDGITCNCGTITGGSSDNSVPDICRFSADIRFNDMKQLQKAQNRVRQIADRSYVRGTECTCRIKTMRRPMELCDANVALFHRINEIFKEYGLPKVRLEKSRGGSDASDMTYYGIPCIDSMGVTGRFIHSVHEEARISSLKEAAVRLAVIAREL